jgi:hypothetical protein
LEQRRVPTFNGLPTASTDFELLTPAASAGPVGFTPSQIRHAYSFDQIRLGSVQGDGSGQTIAIVDAYDNPNIAQDLSHFDRAFGIHDPPSFTKVDENGGRNYPGTDPKGTWELEAALDVEWAHALAPGARIVLVEAASATFDDLNAAVDYARHLPGVSVVSMSYGGTEFDGENGDDSIFTTPAGHSGVTFVASTGDVGGVTEYPAASPNVLAVGGTTLRLSSSGNYVSETGWQDGGGGLSPFETRPAYQKGVSPAASAARSTPDVSFDANPETGVVVYDSYNNGDSTPWVQMGGTSFSAPAWAALLAITDQGRARVGRAPLDGPTQTLPAIYRLPSGDFHDVSSGGALRARPGYDLVSGRGSPVANLLVGDLVQEGAVATHFRIIATTSRTAAGSFLSVTVTALDANGNPVPSYVGTVRFSASDSRAGLPAAYTFTTGDRGSHTFTVSLRTTGAQWLRVTDQHALIGSLAGVVVSPAAVARLNVSSAATANAGTPLRITVAALDAYGNLVSNYRGSVRLSSSDRKAMLPATFTFRAGDGGKHTFSVTLVSPGTWSVTAVDVSHSAWHGTVTVTSRSSPSPNRNRA